MIQSFTQEMAWNLPAVEGCLKMRQMANEVSAGELEAKIR